MSLGETTGSLRSCVGSALQKMNDVLDVIIKHDPSSENKLEVLAVKKHIYVL